MSHRTRPGKSSNGRTSSKGQELSSSSPEVKKKPSKTALDTCQTLINQIRPLLDPLEQHMFDTTAGRNTIAVAEFCVGKIFAATNTPGATVEADGEVMHFLMLILKRYQSCLIKLNERPAHSLSSRIRRHGFLSLNTTLHLEIRGAAEKNDAGWVPAERKEYTAKCLEEFGNLTDAKTLWSKIQCSDVTCVPWDHFFKLFEKMLQIPISPQDESVLRKLITRSGIDYVRPNEFAAFLRAFDMGKITPACVQNARQMWFSNGFFPWCTATDAVKFLEGKPEGTYALSLSYYLNTYYEIHVVAGGKIHKWWIRCDLPFGVDAINPQTPTNSVSFKTLQGLMQHIGATTPLRSDILEEEGFYGDLTESEIAHYLQNTPKGTYIVSYDAETPSKYFLNISYLLNGQIISVPVQKSKEGFRFKPPKQEGRKRIGHSGTFYDSFGSLLQAKRDLFKYNFDFDSVPNVTMCPFHNTGIVTELYGPEKEKEGVLQFYKSLVCAETIGGYPAASLGAILCDRFHVKSFGDRTIFALADGCNWGLRARTAATKAATGFIEYLSDVKLQSEAFSLPMLKEQISRAFRIAHFKIIGDTPIEEIWTICQTTLIGGMLVPLSHNKETKWGLVFYSVGDCKVFLYNQVTGVRDLTYGNRANARNAKDTGGRLGPYVDGGQPDLRNLKSFFWPLKTGDMFFAVSDGVYDNLDPETLGITPTQLGVILGVPRGQNKPALTWDSIPPEDVMAIKDSYTSHKMNQIFLRIKQRTPYYLTRALLKHGMVTTNPSRSFMEGNPTLAEPSDHAAYPGKMDHITAIGVRAGCMLRDLSKLTPKEKKKLLKETKSKESILKKQAKDHRLDEIMYPLKKSIRKTLPKNPIWKQKGVSRDTLGVGESFTVKPGAMGTITRSPGCNVAAISWSTIPLDMEPPSEYFIFESVSSRLSVSALTTNTLYGSTEPAFKTCETFTQHILKNLESAKDTIEMADLMIDGLEAAHKTLVATPLYTSDNALLLGCVCVRHADEVVAKTGKPYTALLINVGSSRAYYWDYLKLQLVELTPDNLNHDTGCIGPSSGSDEKPNIGNCNVYSHPCEAHGIIFLLSPGLCSYFDPYFLGVNEDNHLMSTEEIEETTRAYRNSKLTQILSEAKHSDVSDHVAAIRKQARRAAEKSIDIDDGESEDRSGHRTLLAFRVGPFQEDTPDIVSKQFRIEQIPTTTTITPRPSNSKLPNALTESEKKKNGEINDVLETSEGRKKHLSLRKISDPPDKIDKDKNKTPRK